MLERNGRGSQKGDHPAQLPKTLEETAEECRSSNDRFWRKADIRDIVKLIGKQNNWSAR